MENNNKAQKAIQQFVGVTYMIMGDPEVTGLVKVPYSMYVCVNGYS